MKENETKNYSAQKLAVLGLMTALVFVSNYARIILPISVGGQTAFTLANIVCCLSGLMLGPIGGLASGIGSALYDLMNPLYAAEFWMTFLLKGCMGLMAGIVTDRLLKKGGHRYGKYLTGTVLSCLVYYVLYFIKTFLVMGLFSAEGNAALGITAVVSKIPASVFNAVIAIIAAPYIALILEKALSKAGLQIEG